MFLCLILAVFWITPKSSTFSPNIAETVETQKVKVAPLQERSQTSGVRPFGHCRIKRSEFRDARSRWESGPVMDAAVQLGLNMDTDSRSFDAREKVPCQLATQENW